MNEKKKTQLDLEIRARLQGWELWKTSLLGYEAGFIEKVNLETFPENHSGAPQLPSLKSQSALNSEVPLHRKTLVSPSVTPPGPLLTFLMLCSTDSGANWACSSSRL